jgi:hypothetical protein
MENLCRGWTPQAIRRLIDIATDRQRTLLKALARNSMCTREDLAAALGEGATTKTVDAVLGSLGGKARAIGIRDPEGHVTWPFYISRGRDGRWVYQLPKAVAEIVERGSRAKSHPWEL